jgi:hypothetical protein
LDRSLRRALRVVVVFAAFLPLDACSPPTSTGDAAVRRDVSHDANLTQCVSDIDCSDGVFCNGAERCMPGATGANAFGCLAPSTPTPCLANQECIEGLARCLTQCTATSDADDDGHRAAECGGDDCDDADRGRFPGNAETCDPFHDEDCELTTVGTRDMDGDGEQSSACCNIVLGSPSVCGDDCDDANRSVNRRAPEVCDGVDNNCNGVIDEGVPMQSFFPDCDGDGYGDATGAAVMGCTPPAAAPTCAMPRAASTWAPNNRDCDDADDGRHPGVLELCDNVDNNCDTQVDELPAAMRSCGANPPNGTLACTGGRCRVTCAPPFADCDGNTSNGCEVNLDASFDNCGACGTSCASSIGGRMCANGACIDVPCPFGYHYCGGRCQSVFSTSACGMLSCSPCPTDPHGTADCSTGSCAIICSGEYVAYGTRCLPGPRPIAPLSGAVIHSQSPTILLDTPNIVPFTMETEFCRVAVTDATMACPAAMMIGTTQSSADMPGPFALVPSIPLPSGIVYWRVRAMSGTGRWSPAWWFDLRAGAGAAVGAMEMDLDRNGSLDLAVASPNAAMPSVRIFNGTASGLSTTAGVTITAPATSVGFGTVVTNAGDVNGDGYSDLLVTAPESAGMVGRAYLYLGGAAGVATTPSLTLSGLDDRGLFGTAALGGFDVNADGFGDVAISASATSGLSGPVNGRVYIFYGGPDGLSPNPADVLIAPGSSDGFGAALAAGDFSGDRIADLAVGAPDSFWGGSVYLFYGSKSATPLFGGGPSFTMNATSTDEHFGAQLAMDGDVDGDGHADVAIGSPTVNSSAGRVTILLGAVASPPPRVFDGSVAGEGLGARLAFVGDLDNDGFDDLVSANPDASGGAGALTVLLGSGTRGATVAGPDGALGRFGVALSRIGDTNGDGRADFAVGAEGVMTEAGRVYVFGGAAGGISTTPILTLTGSDGANAHFGGSLAQRASTPWWVAL